MDRIRRARRRLGLSQEELAEASGVSAATIVQVELGNRRPQGRTLRKLAATLGVEVADLLEEEPSPNDEFEQALARVLEPTRTEALREKQAVNRALASGQRQNRVVELAEAEAAKRLADEFSSPEEQRVAFGEVALALARHERDNTDLREALIRAEEVLRQRDQKIAQLEEENAQLREERGLVEAEKA